MKNQSSHQSNGLHGRQTTIVLILLLLSLIRITEAQQLREGGCLDVLTYGKNPETEEWRSYSTPCDVPGGWESSTVRPSSCTETVIYGQNPNNEEWFKFPTACDIPATWKSAICPPLVRYGQNPNTQNWYKFSTPCDVPFGWGSSSSPPNPACPNIITYGQSPNTKNWYIFSTPCDVPSQWQSSTTLPNELIEKSCSSATFSSDGILSIPQAISTDGENTITIEGVKLERLNQIIIPPTFVLKQYKGETTTNSN